MEQKEKQLLLADLCARLPYGVKILHTGWDYDSDTDFDTVETLIGIDDRFIYVVWDKTGDREKHCLSVSNWKPYLRPLSSMTEEEIEELNCLCYHNIDIQDEMLCGYICAGELNDVIDWLNTHQFDYRGLIEKGLSIEAPEGMYIEQLKEK